MPRPRAFGLHQLSQNRSQALLHQKRAGSGNLSVVEEDGRPARGVLVELAPCAWTVDPFQHVLIVRNAALGVVDGRFEHLADGLRAVTLQHRQERRYHARHGEAQMRQRAWACGYLTLALGAIPVDRRQSWSRALATQRKQVSALGMVQHEYALGCQRVRSYRLGHSSRETCCDQRVEGIAAGQQHPHTRHRREVVAA